MPGKFPRKIKCQLASGAQEIEEMNNVLRKGVLVKLPSPDSENFLCENTSHSPGIPAEIELGYLWLNSAKTCLLRRHLKLYFLGDHWFI